MSNKHLDDFERWTNSAITSSFSGDSARIIDNLINEKAENKLSRSVPREQDLMYKAANAYPGRDPQQALMMYVNDKLDNSQKQNQQQNAVITQLRNQIASMSQVPAQGDAQAEKQPPRHETIVSNAEIKQLAKAAEAYKQEVMQTYYTKADQEKFAASLEKAKKKAAEQPEYQVPEKRVQKLEQQINDVSEKLNSADRSLSQIRVPKTLSRYMSVADYEYLREYISGLESKISRDITTAAGKIDYKTQGDIKTAVNKAIADFKKDLNSAIFSSDAKTQALVNNAISTATKAINDDIAKSQDDAISSSNNYSDIQIKKAVRDTLTFLNKKVLRSVSDLDTKIQTDIKAASADAEQNALASAKSYADTRAAGAETNANKYADVKAANAERNTKRYADIKAADAESNAKQFAYIKAADAERNANKYANNKAADAERNANKYADDAIATSKDASIDTSKKYTDEELKKEHNKLTQLITAASTPLGQRIDKLQKEKANASDLTLLQANFSSIDPKINKASADIIDLQKWRANVDAKIAELQNPKTLAAITSGQGTMQDQLADLKATLSSIQSDLGTNTKFQNTTVWKLLDKLIRQAERPAAMTTFFGNRVVKQIEDLLFHKDGRKKSLTGLKGESTQKFITTLLYQTENKLGKENADQISSIFQRYKDGTDASDPNSKAVENLIKTYKDLTPIYQDVKVTGTKIPTAGYYAQPGTSLRTQRQLATLVHDVGSLETDFDKLRDFVMTNLDKTNTNIRARNTAASGTASASSKNEIDYDDPEYQQYLSNVTSRSVTVFDADIIKAFKEDFQTKKHLEDQVANFQNSAIANVIKNSYAFLWKNLREISTKNDQQLNHAQKSQISNEFVKDFQAYIEYGGYDRALYPDGQNRRPDIPQDLVKKYTERFDEFLRSVVNVDDTSNYFNLINRNRLDIKRQNYDRFYVNETKENVSEAVTKSQMFEDMPVMQIAGIKRLAMHLPRYKESFSRRMAEHNPEFNQKGFESIFNRKFHVFGRSYFIIAIVNQNLDNPIFALMPIPADKSSDKLLATDFDLSHVLVMSLNEIKQLARSDQNKIAAFTDKDRFAVEFFFSNEIFSDIPSTAAITNTHAILPSTRNQTLTADIHQPKTKSHKLSYGGLPSKLNHTVESLAENILGQQYSKYLK